jgi:hypothetical protein
LKEVFLKGGGALGYDVNSSPGLGQTHRCSFDVVSQLFTILPAKLYFMYGKLKYN